MVVVYFVYGDSTVLADLGGVGFTLADGVVDISQILLDMQVARAGGNRPGTGFGICIDGHGSWS